MGMKQFEVDVDALAEALEDSRRSAQGFLRGDLHSGFGPGGPETEGLRYPLRRLRGLRQISEEDERELGELADASRSGATGAEALAAAIRARPNASPLARVLAAAAVGGLPELQTRRLSQALAGAIAGAYLAPNLVRGGDSGWGTLPEELVGVLGAVGGALAADALGVLQEIQEH